jgi:hypothetical protein|nr:MAG TPA: hypothetical protein [Caudoviricetes sp.]
MRDIRLPETSDKVIDVFNVNENISGIILAYKYNKPVGFIVYKDEEWEYFDDITIDCSYKYNENLSKLLKTIMSSNYADSFKLVDFGQ